jgi:DNA polymerase sigma
MLPVAIFGDGSEADAQQRVRAARAAFKCSLGLGELLVTFFQFYSQEFYWGSEVVSVRLGSRLDVGQPFFRQLKARRMNRLHVEDPVDLTRNLNCVLGEAQEMQLRTLMEEAFAPRLTMGKELSVGYPSKQAGPQHNKFETKGRTVSSVSTAADSGASSTDEAVDGEEEKEPLETGDGTDQYQSIPQHTAIELEKLLLGETVLQGSAKHAEIDASPSPTKKHALLKLLHGSQDLKGEPQAPQQAQGGSWTVSTRPRQMSQASQSIAAKVAAACKQRTASLQ